MDQREQICPLRPAERTSVRPTATSLIVSRRAEPFRELGQSLCSARDARFGSIVLKDLKIAHWRFQPLLGSVESIRRPAIIFAIIEVVPHRAARETHRRC